MLMLVLGLVLGVIILISGVAASRGSLFQETLGLSFGNKAGSIPATATPAELVSEAYRIVELIKEEDYKDLANVVHPDNGVVISPYATITLATNKRFTPKQVAAFADDAQEYVWGVYNGTGEPIELTPKEFFSAFVFNKDYTYARELGVDYVVKSGNSLENLTEVFPGIRFVDFHIPTDAKSVKGIRGVDGETAATDVDWNSLRLGFEEYEGTLRLTVIMHSEWTA